MTTFLSKTFGLLNSSLLSKENTDSVKIKPSYFFLLATFLFTSVSAAQQVDDYNSGSISFVVDNDSFTGTDREYSSGVYLKFNSASASDINKLGPVVINKIGEFLPLSDDSKKVWGVTIGQQLWTPSDISLENEIINERPYAAYLMIKTHLNEYSAFSATKYSFTIGEVGPQAFGEQAQKAIHGLISSPIPMGWNGQIKARTIFALGYEKQKALIRDNGGFGHEYDIAINGRVNASNFQNEIAIGSTLRWGTQLAGSFSSVSLSPTSFFDPSVLSNSKSGYFTYLSAEARYRQYDYTIDGARPKHLYDISVQHWQSTVATGVVYYQPTWGLALSAIASSKSYNEDVKSYHSIASLEFFWRM